MKVAIITDQHFGARKSSRVFHDFFNKFYKNVFFPTLKERKIDTVLDLGDTYDNRRTLDLWAANWSKTEYWDKLMDMGIKVHSLVGITQHILRTQMTSILLMVLLASILILVSTIKQQK